MILFYCGLIFISFAFTWLMRMYAIHYAIIDIPNDRSSHTVATPRGGGVAVAVTWFIGLTWLFLSKKIESSLFYALLCGIPLTLIGFADDIFSLKPIFRFVIQFLSAGLALYFLGGMNNLGLGFWNLNMPYLLTPLAFVAIIWSINLFNFLDGIDGYIGTEVVFIGIAAGVLLSQVIGYVFAASILGFLVWNWPKAKIFMGDVGSTLLGFTIAIFAIYFQNVHISNLPIWLMLTSLFWYDATITLWRRFRNNEKLSVAHRKHAYQRLVQSGWSHQKTTLGALLMNGIGFAIAFMAYKIPQFDWCFLGLDIILMFLTMRFIDHRKPFEI